jgi:hypothetical protein
MQSMERDEALMRRDSLLREVLGNSNMSQDQREALEAFITPAKPAPTAPRVVIMEIPTQMGFIYLAAVGGQTPSLFKEAELTPGIEYLEALRSPAKYFKLVTYNLKEKLFSEPHIPDSVGTSELLLKRLQEPLFRALVVKAATRHTEFVNPEVWFTRLNSRKLRGEKSADERCAIISVLVHPAIDATYGREWKERAISFAINDDSPLVRAQVTLVIRKSTKAQINSDTIPVLESAFKDKAWMVKRQALLWLLQESPTDPASRKLLHKFWLKSYRDEKVATCQLVRVFPNSELPGVILFNEEFSSSEFRDLSRAFKVCEMAGGGRHLGYHGGPRVTKGP